MGDSSKTFWGLLRSSSSAAESPRAKDGKIVSRRAEHRSQHHHSSTAPEDTRNDEGRAMESPSPIESGIRSWPPQGMSEQDDLSQAEAELVMKGAPIFEGRKYPILHLPEDYFALYALCRTRQGVTTDCARFSRPTYAAVTLRQDFSSRPASRPWITLEQPSYAFWYGIRPGTTTLNHWATISSNRKPPELKDSFVRARQVDLEPIISRLILLQDTVDEDPNNMYRELYKFLKDPDKYFGPHKAIEKQIADLIIVLSGKDWIDFSDPRNQIVAKFFSNSSRKYEKQTTQFFYQLLLSIELDRRIHSKHHDAETKEALLRQLPPCVSFSLAVARRWQDNMLIEKPTGIIESMKHAGLSETKLVKLRLLNKKHQVKSVRKFARSIRWPNIETVDDFLKSQDREHVLHNVEDLSSDSMSYFTGVVLPGNTLPFLIMNALLDCDKDVGPDLAMLTHLFPSAGFQYKSNTFWSSHCIVGKVLAPASAGGEIAGWIGGCRPTADLSATQIARVRQRRSKFFLEPKHVRSMKSRSDPIGPPSETYPISEYQIVTPLIENTCDTIRVEKLVLKSVPGQGGKTDDIVQLFDASIQFAIKGKSWPLRLSFDVSFIAACPCEGMLPHPLFYDYIYKAVRADEILDINDWGHLVGAEASSSSKEISKEDTKSSVRDDELERVLVIEAMGVSDNEILSRAYCSHWGLSAIVANIKETCMACSIREAYAACINVVILVDDEGRESGE